MKIKYFTLALLVGLSSCVKESAENTEMAYAATETVEAYAGEAPTDAVYADAKEKSLASTDYENIEAKIIKTANLRFPSDNLEESYTSIQMAITQYKAYIQNDNSGKNYNTIYRNITIRIPNANFDAFINEISKGVTYFDRKEISAQDVTEEFVDIEARLKAKKVLEARYLELLKKATKVSEMLEIESSLSAIREEIEAKEGRIKYLENQVGMSTISIEMYTEKASGSGTTVSYGSKMWNKIKGGFNLISNFFLDILYNWPLILILAIAFVIIRRKLKKRNQKNEETI